MNNRTALRLFIITIIISVAALGITACHKTPSASPMGTIMMHLHSNIDTNEIDDTTALYRDATGRHFGLQTAQFYISNVKLQNVDGSVYTILNALVLKNIDSETYVIGTAPIGIYSSVTFDVGLDNTSNSEQPYAFTNTGYVSNATMYYDSTQGYMAMKLLGFADTTAAQTGANRVPFLYEIASAIDRKTVTMPTRGTGTYASYPVYTVINGGTTYIHVICDYGKLLAGIDFKTQDNTDTYTSNPGTATIIANNITSMFRYEE